ncbi:2Fe-2S iron-sulfur cluster-binding protein [Paenibacillus sp. J5C_2022]|uniref:2Fe-2S iron-sulfur cluster-binding protein n=1 Tax=Paenibacillus sp. J5C2022 TaxID=2977129 RepID=UPI0021D210B9|nr:2Fe-2S iron-sulfur cluster-binding protein [Paenibacillus sp. J5C2022]MCU6710021.1 2Fe-2S iron-sulfur cluster-binding protein [Paenibacillus sp. J5C2022]
MEAEVTFLPSGRTVQVRRGTSLLDAARRAGVHIPTRCGGKAACFMCKVKVTGDSELLPIGEAERRKLAGMQDQAFRLACQARAAGKVEVHVPLDPLRAAVQKQLELARNKNKDDELW